MTSGQRRDRCHRGLAAPLPHPDIAPLFPDSRAVERAYYRATRIFPIVHLVVIRRDVYERHPWIASSLYKGFVHAKAAFAATFCGRQFEGRISVIRLAGWSVVAERGPPQRLFRPSLTLGIEMRSGASAAPL